jgi:ribosome biogenesis GTPase A
MPSERGSDEPLRRLSRRPSDALVARIRFRRLADHGGLVDCPGFGWPKERSTRLDRSTKPGLPMDEVIADSVLDSRVRRTPARETDRE